MILRAGIKRRKELSEVAAKDFSRARTAELKGSMIDRRRILHCSYHGPKIFVEIAFIIFVGKN